jgi:hypothetical protein
MPLSINSKNYDLIHRSAHVNATSLGRLNKDTAVVAKLIDDGDTPKPPAPAWYEPNTEEIYIHVDAAGINPKHITGPISTRLGGGLNKSEAKLLGLFAHEMGHSHISGELDAVIDRAKKTGITPNIIDVMELLEEVRVEAFVIRKNPKLRQALRASFTIILKAIAENPPETIAGAAHAWAVVHGRTLAGVSTPTETLSFDTATRTMIGDDVVDQLVELLQEASQIDMKRDGVRYGEIAEEWAELVGATNEDEDDGTCTEARDEARGESKDGETGAEAGEEDPYAGGGSRGGEEESEAGGSDGDEAGEAGDAEGEGKDGEGEGSPDYGTEGGGKKSTALDQEAKELGEAVAEDLRQIMNDEWNATPRNPDLSDPRETAARVFGKETSGAIEKQEPRAYQRQAVIDVAGFLSNISIKQITKSDHNASTPPGRLRSREGVRRSAERSRGMMVSAKPWKGSKRQYAAAKPLVIGLATDTSGSMRWAEGAVAEFAYVYANAGHRIGARTAAVTFGDYVYMTARPGEVSQHLMKKYADGGTEECDEALAALDGVLRLTDPSMAARILVVVSDGALVKSDETGKVTEWLHRMDRAGTHVIWVNNYKMHDGFWLQDLVKTLPNLEFVEIERSPKTRTLPGMENQQEAQAHALYLAIDAAVRKAILAGPASNAA